jgi:hypothetical protein
MDVNSALLNDVVQEEVFVTQPPGFENSKYPNRVYNFQRLCTGLSKHRGLGMLGLRLSC